MKKRMPTVTAILLAGGNGQRAGNIFKQFSKINGRPLIQYSLDVFVKNTFIDTIAIVVPKNVIGKKEKEIFGKYDKNKIVIIEGGKSRKNSTLNALDFLSRQKKTPDYVIIHDAVRPLISDEVIELVLKEAIMWGASTIGIPAIDLLYEVSKGKVKKAHNKKDFYYGFTPQCFRFEDILMAHRKATKTRSYLDSSAIELLKMYKKGTRVKMIDNFYPNIKYTYKEDKKLIEFLLKNDRP